jgi:uncharacterized protein (TIGR03086 family)
MTATAIMDPVELVERAFSATRAVVALTTPADYPRPTPCDEWGVRTLVNHIVGGAYWYAETMRDRVSPSIEGDDDDVCAGDPLVAYDDGIAQAVDALRAPGALDGSIAFIGRDRPAATVASLCALDTFVHGWDLARALDRRADLDPADLDPAVAEALLVRTAGSIPDALRGTDADALYRPVSFVPADAPPADRLAAFLGRTP